MNRILTITTPINMKVVDMTIEKTTNLKEDDTLNIYINTTGGELSSTFIMIDILNNLIDKGIKISLVGTERLYSAGFMLFMLINTENKKTISVTGMIHKANYSTDVKSNHHLKEDSFYQSLEQYNNKIIKYFRLLGIGEKEITKYKQYKDVMFNDEKMGKILLNNITMIKEKRNRL